MTSPFLKPPTLRQTHCRMWIAISLSLTLGICLLSQQMAEDAEDDGRDWRALDALYHNNHVLYRAGFEEFIANRYLSAILHGYETGAIKPPKAQHAF